MSTLDRLQLHWGRLPMLLQIEAAECGLACIAMLASYFGHRAEPAGLRRRFGLSLKGATLREVMRIAGQLGMASRPVRLAMDELPLLRTPCVLHWDLNHFVVLRSVGRGGAVIHDPGVGIRRMALAEVFRHFTGVALEITPTARFEIADRPPRVRMRALLGNLVGLKRSLGHLLALALVLEVFALVSPLFLV